MYVSRLVWLWVAYCLLWVDGWCWMGCGHVVLEEEERGLILFIGRG